MDSSGPVAVLPPKEENANRGVRLIYANGVEVVHGGPSGVTFIGTDGVIHVDRGRLVSVPDTILAQPLDEKAVHLPQWPNHHENWIACIRTRERPICDVEIGARSVTVCHLGNLAYWHRRKLRWDPDRWRFPDNDEANRWLDYERRRPYTLPSL